MKTIQFFLSIHGVDEVKADDNSKLSCTCDGFRMRRKCKHLMWIELEIKKGTFPIQIEKYTPQEEIDKAKDSPEAFRELLIKYGKIQVI